MKGQAISSLIITVGAGMFILLSGWDGWITNITFSDHAELSSLSASVSDLHDRVVNELIPTVNDIARHQGTHISSYVASSTSFNE